MSSAKATGSTASNQLSARKLRRLNVRMDVGAFERLSLHCLKTNIKPGALLSKLVLDHCKGWSIRENRKGQRIADEVAGEDEVFE
jgi:hypothetical protein